MHNHCVGNQGLLQEQNQQNKYILQSRIARLTYTTQSGQYKRGCLDIGNTNNSLLSPGGQIPQLSQSGTKVLKNSQSCCSSLFTEKPRNLSPEARQQHWWRQRICTHTQGIREGGHLQPCFSLRPLSLYCGQHQNCFPCPEGISLFQKIYSLTYLETYLLTLSRFYNQI